MGSKVAKFLKKNQNVTLHLGTDGCHETGFSGGIYVDVILVQIKTRLYLLGIQTFRWDQRLQLQNFFMALGRQYNSNLNRHVSTQENKTRGNIVPHQAWCLKKNQTTPRPSEHPPVMGEKCQNV